MKFTFHFIDGKQRTYNINEASLSSLQLRAAQWKGVFGEFKSVATDRRELVNLTHVICIEEFIDTPDSEGNSAKRIDSEGNL